MTIDFGFIDAIHTEGNKKHYFLTKIFTDSSHYPYAHFTNITIKEYLPLKSHPVCVNDAFWYEYEGVDTLALWKDFRNIPPLKTIAIQGLLPCLWDEDISARFLPLLKKLTREVLPNRYKQLLSAYNKKKKQLEEDAKRRNKEALLERKRKRAHALKIRTNKIREFVQGRDIEYLVHFTHVSNLPSIMEKGLLSRSSLVSNRVEFQYNDIRRLDEHLDAISISISFPNYRMLYKYRRHSKEECYVVLILQKEILWSLDCAFCFTNAAANAIRYFPIEQLKGPQSLNAMFRAAGRGKVKKSYTTDPQAEVLVFDPIPPSFISAIHCNSRLSVDRLCKVIEISEGIPIRSNDSFFEPRCDYPLWQ